LLADIYVARDDMLNAILYHKKYETIQDTIIARMQSDNQAEAEAKFNLVKRTGNSER